MTTQIEIQNRLNNIVSNLENPLERALAQTLYNNEVRGNDPYILSHAEKDNSGFSFGYHQLDLANNDIAVRKLESILKAHYGAEEGSSIYSNVEQGILTQGNPRSLTPNQKSQINEALSSSEGKAIIDSAFVDGIRDSISAVRSLEDRLSSQLGRDIVFDDGATILLADYHNQFAIIPGYILEQNLGKYLSQHSELNKIDINQARAARLMSAHGYENRMDEAENSYNNYKHELDQYQINNTPNNSSINQEVSEQGFISAVKDLFGNLIADAQTIASFIQDTLDSLFRAEFQVQPRRVDPLALDLDGDGLELVNVRNSTAFFDLDIFQSPSGEYVGDGLKEQVGWVGSDDGLLALDRNGNGRIDNVLELFGNQTKTGTEVLREFDLNGDGVIDSSDAVFGQLKVWRDLNQDGISDLGNDVNKPNELFTLNELGITSINLNNLTNVNQVQNNNLIISQSLSI